MLRSVRERLTYANVMSTIAVFGVLAGGSAYAAAKLKNNSVTTPKIRDGAVVTSKLADGSVVGSKLADGVVSRSKLASGIGQCPAGTTKVLPDLCADSTDRGALGSTIWSAAIDGCDAAGESLPTISEALAMYPVLPHEAETIYWTGDITSSTEAAVINAGGPSVSIQSRNTQSGYRCVTTPTAP
jgi:hypothetical protein